MKPIKLSFIVIFSCLALGLGGLAYAQDASTTDILKGKIEERNNQIKQLEVEINQYNSEVDKAAKEAVTLKSTIKTLDLTKRLDLSIFLVFKNLRI